MYMLIALRCIHTVLRTYLPAALHRAASYVRGGQASRHTASCRLMDTRMPQEGIIVRAQEDIIARAIYIYPIQYQ